MTRFKKTDPKPATKRQRSKTHQMVSLSPEAVEFAHDLFFVHVRDDIDRLDRAITGTRGPRRRFPLSVLTLGLAALIAERQPPQILLLSITLAWYRKRFPDDYRAKFGTDRVPRPHNLYHLLERLKKWAGNPGRERDERLDELADAIIDASVRTHLGDDGWPADIAVDGSLVRTNSVNPGTAKGRAGQGSDPDARVRKYDRGDGGLPTVVYGYRLFAAAGRVAGRERVLKVMVRAANTSEVPMADAVVAAMTDQGTDEPQLIQDRGMSQDTQHLDRSRSAGIPVSFDLRKDQIGFRGYYRGCLVIDGGLYAPCMPQRLRQSKAYNPGGTPEEKAEFFAFHDEREAYRFVANGTKNRARSIRLQSPAVRRRLRCPHVPESMTNPDPTVPVCDGDHAEDEGCAARNVTFSRDNSPLYQYPFWGTREWHSLYKRRNYSERFFSHFKPRFRVGYGNAGLCLRGQTKYSFVLFITAAIANICLEYGDYAESKFGPLFADTG